MIGSTAAPGFWQAMGLLLLAITVLYAWPRTAVLGAILLTGYLGGAVATHVRTAIRSSATHCSASIWASLYGAACGCATRALETFCRLAE